MEISVIGRHVKVSEEVKEYATRKAAKIEKFYDRIQHVDVVLDHEGDQFFRKLITPVVVGTVGRQNRQAIRMVIGADQMVRRRLGRRIGRVGRVWGRLREISGFAKRTVYLVGRNVQEAEIFLICASEAVPVCARGFKQGKRADNVGLDEIPRRVDRTVHVRFGGKIHQGARAMLL